METVFLLLTSEDIIPPCLICGQEEGEGTFTKMFCIKDFLNKTFSRYFNAKTGGTWRSAMKNFLVCAKAKSKEWFNE